MLTQIQKLELSLARAQRMRTVFTVNATVFKNMARQGS